MSVPRTRKAAKFRVIADTGAARTVMNEKYMKRLEIKKTDLTPTKLNLWYGRIKIKNPGKNNIKIYSS